MNLDKDQLKRHILDSDLTAMEKRYLEVLVDGTRWIPCSEKMPESGLEVHVYAKTLKGLGYCFDAYYAASTGKWHTYTSWAKEEIVGYRSDVSHDFIITHWMPIADRPKV